MLGLTEFHIGIDDTDSRTGGCTTYTATLVFNELWNRGFVPSDFPWLVRLNPNIPWKTRGNGALAIHLLLENKSIDEARRTVIRITKDTAELSSPTADPAVVFLKGPIDSTLKRYSYRALHEVITVKEAKTISDVCGAETSFLKGTRGLIGSLAAIGADLENNTCTFEIIAYRSKDHLGQPRRIDPESVRRMNSLYGGQSFHNLDPETGRVLVAPHGPDPVLLGIRGHDPNIILQAFKQVRVDEPIETVMIFRTNQGTDAHIKQKKKISDLSSYQSGTLSGRVETVPRVLKGGHVIFRLTDETGSIDCLAFKQSGPVQRSSRELLPGDRISVSGGVQRMRRGRLSMNLEKLRVIHLTTAYHEENPRCPSCGSRCESMGKDQGFRCKKCGLREVEELKEKIPLRRGVEKTTQIPPPRARRHLTMPYSHKHSDSPKVTLTRSSFERLFTMLNSNSIS